MSDDVDSETEQDGSGQTWCRQVGDAALDGFLAFVAGQAAAGLTMDRLRALAAAFKGDPAIMAGRYGELWRAGGFSRRGDDTPDRRSAPLQRLLVEKFEHLLAPAGSDLKTLADGSPAIPRAAIPGILSALATMAPGNLWDLARRRCVDIVASLRQRHGADFTWALVERNPEVGQLVDDVRLAVLPYFDDFAKRRRWFVTVVDRHQPELGVPDAAGVPIGHFDLLDDRNFDRLFAGLFADLAERLRDREARARLYDHYGAAAVAALEQLIGHLPGLDRESVPA
ncbi:MAG: hypothetical protein R3F55_08480 [Alphaproteobacteria bacterium]